MKRAAIGLLCLALAASAEADAPQSAAEAAERLRLAAVELEEATQAEDRIGALTETIRAYELGLAAMRDALRDARLEERAIRAHFDAEAERLARILAALETLGRAPEADTLLHPSGGLGTARASMLMADLVPALRAEVSRLKLELDDLAVLTLLRRDALETLESGLDGIQTARAALAQAVAERRELPAALATDAAAMQALLNDAETLDAFAATLADTSASAPTGFAEARGSLPFPVDGVRLAGFGEPDASGVRRPGLLLGTVPRALITAPWPSTIRYAGPLLDLGNVVILEPGEGYLLVLAGLSEVYGTLGTVLAAGEPVGLAGGQSRGAQEILIETADGSGQVRSETLYMELRTRDGPVDPADWFAETKG